MSRRIGRQTVVFANHPGVVSWAGIAGPKEKEGPYGDRFDQTIADEMNGEKSFEAAERRMLETTIRLCAQKSHHSMEAIQMLLGGDLLNQIVSSGFAARELGIPFYGLYGACSTMAESLALGGMLADGGFADRLICATCSHFCTAERQYRTPLELGCQRTPTAQWTVTGAGAVMLASGPAAEGARVELELATTGRVIDLGIKDANNMGAAMAPAAADTIAMHLADARRGFDDYDLIVTGDLGSLGRDLLFELLGREGLELPEEKLFDCGCEIYDARQDAHAGGSGCGCSASMLCAYLLPELRKGNLRRILFIATGALLSPTTTMQGESIPGIAHAVVFAHREETTC